MTKQLQQRQGSELAPERVPLPRARPARSNADAQAQLPGKGDWKALLKTLKEATDDKIRKKAAMALAQWCRTNLPDTALLERYIAQPGVSAEDKTATIGKVQAALARNEFLLGVGHEGGTGTWETGGANKGPMMDYYLETIKLDGQVSRKNAAWCTSFVGTQAERAGFDFNTDAGKSAGARSIFWSGSRLNNWATTGKNNSGKSLNGSGDRVGDETDGSAVISAADWKALKAAIDKAKDKKEKKAALDAFFKKHPQPQAGDVLVVGKNNAFYGKGNSHTVMVEQYNAASGVVSAIEGNADNRVKGRTIDLTDSGEVGKIVFVARMGVEQYDDPGNTKTNKGMPAPAPDAAKVSASQVLAKLNEINAALAGLAVGKDWVKGDDASATVSELYHGSGSGKDTGGATR